MELKNTYTKTVWIFLDLQYGFIKTFIQAHFLSFNFIGHARGNYRLQNDLLHFCGQGRDRMYLDLCLSTHLMNDHFCQFPTTDRSSAQDYECCHLQLLQRPKLSYLSKKASFLFFYYSHERYLFRFVNLTGRISG